MRAKISATRAAEPNADNRPISTPAPVGVPGSDGPGYMGVKVFVFVLKFVFVFVRMFANRRGVFAKSCSRMSLFRRERWLEMTDIVGEVVVVVVGRANTSCCDGGSGGGEGGGEWEWRGVVVSVRVVICRRRESSREADDWRWRLSSLLESG